MERKPFLLYFKYSLQPGRGSNRRPLTETDDLPLYHRGSLSRKTRHKLYFSVFQRTSSFGPNKKTQTSLHIWAYNQQGYYYRSLHDHELRGDANPTSPNAEEGSHNYNFSSIWYAQYGHRNRHPSHRGGLSTTILPRWLLVSP